MTVSATTFVIVHTSRSATSVYACTVENLQALAEQAAGGYPMIEYAYQAYLRSKAEGPAVLAAEDLAAALRELYDSQDGDELPRLRSILYGPAVPGDQEVGRPLVTARLEWQQELALWAFSNRERIPGSLEGFGMSAEALAATYPFETLSFLQGVKDRLPRGVVLLDRCYAKAAAELYEMRNGRWNSVDAVRDVARRVYLPFIQTWAGGAWEVVAVQTESTVLEPAGEPEAECRT